MQILHSSYQSLKNWHDQNIVTYQSNTDKLQLFHEYIMKQVFEIALVEMKKVYGSPPCEYAWFVTGSAGRLEQTVLSDQDHGIIYNERNEHTESYFLTLGEKLTSGLHDVGYPLCQGNVMSSNPLWCRSIGEWEMLIKKWMKENTWESLRYLLIFYDARVVVGNKKMLPPLKQLIYRSISEQPFLLSRLLENTKRTLNVIGLFGQFLTVKTGPYTGCINLKQSAIFPYVNAIRLLAIYEKIEKTSTISRIEILTSHPQYKKILDFHKVNFKKLLQHRLKHSGEINDQDNQYLHVISLNKKAKLEMKQILKDVKELQKNTEVIIQRAASK